MNRWINGFCKDEWIKKKTKIEDLNGEKEKKENRCIFHEKIVKDK